jgi:hypothetical protein
MEISQVISPHAPGRPKRPRPDAAANRERKRPARRQRLARTTLGFWIGGSLLGTAGCLLGVCMPYHHPVAVTIGALWWGIYLGCLGASIGALVSLVTKRNPAPPGQR